MSMKSISPIVASILIIVITVAIAGIFYAFTSGLFGSLTQSSSQQIQQQSQVTSFTISNIYCSNNILYFNIYNNGNVPIDINNSEILFTDNNGNIISINGSNIICNNGNIIPSGSNSLCYIINNYFCYYSYTDYIKSMNYVYNGISYSYNVPNNNNFNIIYLPNSSSYPITIYNTQNIPAPSPFQQDIAICNGSINIGNNFAYVNNVTLFNQINPNGQNVIFFNPNNNQLFYYSWYEGQLNYNGVTCDVWWVNIPNGIPANSNITIYMYIGSNSANYYSQYYPYVGEAPYLSLTYGQYDNGNYVFNIYQNFAGTTLPSGWTAVSGTSGTDYVVNNGLQLKTTNAFIEGPNMTQNFILEGYFQFISNAYNGWDFGVYSSSSSAYGMHPDGGGNTNTWVGTYYYNNGYTAIGSGAPVGTGYYYLWQIINNAGNITVNFDTSSYTTLYSASFKNSLSNGHIALGKRFDGNYAGQSLNVIFYWIRVRAYPPNGVMPLIYIS